MSKLDSVYAPYPPYPPYPPYAPFPPVFITGARWGSRPGAVGSPELAASPLGSPSPSPFTPWSPPGPGGSPPPLVVSPPPVLVSPPPVQRSPFPVSSITLAPDPQGLHHGTGDQQGAINAVDPGTVPGGGQLAFAATNTSTTALLYQLAADVVPNWFGVAVPSGVSDYTKPLIYFHPIPAQAGYKDADYPTKAGKWPQLFYYMERLGYQLDAAGSQDIVVMPFLTSAATDTGIFAANWWGIVSDILTDVRARRGAASENPLNISQVATASFSVGIVYMHAFLSTGAGVEPSVAHVYDFDGALSSAASLSHALISTSDYTVVKYDQGNLPSSYHVPRARWTRYPQPPATTLAVHHLIRDTMLRHAVTV